MWRAVLLAALAVPGCDSPAPTHLLPDSGLAPLPRASAEDPYEMECARGGLSGPQRSECARFLAFLATPPRCPERPRITAPSYGGCPSEAKVMPRHMGSLELEKAEDPGKQAVISALQASFGMRLCYAAALVEQPKLAGYVRLSLVVDRLGRFQSVSAAGSSFADPLAVECFVRQAAELRVSPAPTEPRRVHVELKLVP